MKGAEIIAAAEHGRWREALADFPRVDVCHMPEYHEAYSLRIGGARALMWRYCDGGETLCYPFLLSPVILRGPDGGSESTPFTDISGIYGYSGPLATTSEREFLDPAWREFDRWAAEQAAISEFIRFSTYVGNEGRAHPDTAVEFNRPVAIARLPEDDDKFLAALNGKTRNMIRKAWKAGLVAREVTLAEALDAFRGLYEKTMERNQASGFFFYDDAYYERLLQLPPGELRLFAVYDGNDMIAAAMGLVHADMAFYHLGASTLEASRQGAGNLALFEMARGLINSGVGYFSVGGGRTTRDDDALYRFKRSNATDASAFYIGKRVIDGAAYASIVKSWETMNHTPMTSPNLQFYR